jgi:ATP-dependent RNA helicase DeaD
MDGIDVSKLIEVIDDASGLGKSDIGRIDLKGAYSFFEVDTEKADQILKGFSGIEYKGRQVRVEVTEQKEFGSRSRSSSSSSRDNNRGGGGGRSSGRSSGGGSRSRSSSSDQKKKWR